MSPSRRLRSVCVLATLFVLAASLLAFGSLARAEDPPAKAGGIPADTEVKTTASGLRYSVLVAGAEGKHPKRGEKVKVHYTGWLTDGTKFDGSRDRGAPAEFTVGQLVEGWNEALCLMTKGARWKLTIPSKLGYGDRGSPPRIPANATLVFELELVDFQSLPDFRACDAAAQKKTESGLKYEVIAEGSGEAPGADDAIEFKYALWTQMGELLDCSERSGGTIKLRRADLPFPFMKEGVALLKPGTRIRFEVPPELCFGAESKGPQLPANSVTVWEMELVRSIKPLSAPAFALPDDTKLTKTASGLKYEVIEAGEGASPKMGARVKVHYAGWLTDGTLFDSSYGRGEEMELRLGQVIRGWNEGLQLMKTGSTWRFVIPPELAYGPTGAGGKIGPNATLVFVIKLVKVLD